MPTSRHATPWMLVLVSVLGVWIGGTPPCRAAPSEADKAQARALVRSGKELALHKQYARALEQFQAAYRHWPNYKIQFNIALVYLEMGNKLAAYEHLRRFLEAAPPGTRSKLPEPLLRLLSQVGTLRISTSGRDLDIYVNGVRRGSRQVSVAVLPGRYRVELRKGSRTVQQKQLRVAGGAVVVWEAAVVKVGTDGATARRMATQGSGSGTGGQGASAGRRKKLHWAYFVAAGSVAVLAAGAFIGTGVKTLQLGSNYNKTGDQDLADEGRRYKLATNILIGVSAAAGLTAAVIAFFTRWRSRGAESGRVSLRPGVAPGGVSLCVDVAF